MHNELPWIWWELGSLLLLEEWAFPVFTKSVQFSQEKLETATICPGPCISPKSPKAETVGLRGCCEGPPLMHLPCRQTEPWRGMEKAPRAQRTAGRRMKRYGKHAFLPSPCCGVSWHPNTNIPGLLTKPSCFIAVTG